MSIDRIRVIFILKNLKLGGAENRICTLVSNIDHNKFDVRVAAIVAGGEWENRLKKRNIPMDER